MPAGVKPGTKRGKYQSHRENWKYEAFCEWLLNPFMFDAKTLTAFAKEIGVCRYTVTRWKRTPDVQRAIQLRQQYNEKWGSSKPKKRIRRWMVMPDELRTRPKSTEKRSDRYNIYGQYIPARLRRKPYKYEGFVTRKRY